MMLLVSLLLSCEEHLQPLCRDTAPVAATLQLHTAESSVAEPSGAPPQSISAATQHGAVGTGDCGTDDGGGGYGVAQIAEAMQQALWALAAVVDGCAAAERDFLDCGGVANVSRCATCSLSLSLDTYTVHRNIVHGTSLDTYVVHSKCLLLAKLCAFGTAPNWAKGRSLGAHALYIFSACYLKNHVGTSDLLLRLGLGAGCCTGF